MPTNAIPTKKNNQSTPHRKSPQHDSGVEEILDLFDEAGVNPDIPIQEEQSTRVSLPKPKPVLPAAKKNSGTTPGRPLESEEEVLRAFSALPAEQADSIKKDDVLDKRFQHIVGAYVKDIRDRFETRQRLVARQGEGGMGFDHEFADKILHALHANEGAVPVKKSFSLPPPPPPLPPSRVKPKAPPGSEVQAKPDTVPPPPAPPKAAPSRTPESGLVAPPPSPPVSKSPAPPSAGLHVSKIDLKKLDQSSSGLSKPPIPGLSELPKVPQPPPAPLPTDLISPASAPSVSSPLPGQPLGVSESVPIQIEHDDTPRARRSVEPPEFVRPDTLTKPTEEFASLSIEDMRRAKTPAEFVKKILDKIEVLADDDYNKRGEAIRAWKRSPLNQAYLNIGNKALEEKMDITEYLQSDKGGLNLEEFEAVGVLNEKVRF